MPSEFVTEDLPPDFWESEPQGNPLEPATTGRASPERAPADRAPPGKVTAAPLFAELQSLFPGRVLRVEPLEAAPPPEEPEADPVQDGLFADTPED